MFSDWRHISVVNQKTLTRRFFETDGSCFVLMPLWVHCSCFWVFGSVKLLIFGSSSVKIPYSRVFLLTCLRQNRLQIEGYNLNDCLAHTHTHTHRVRERGRESRILNSYVIKYADTFLINVLSWMSTQWSSLVLQPFKSLLLLNLLQQFFFFILTAVITSTPVWRGKWTILSWIWGKLSLP